MSIRRVVAEAAMIVAGTLFWLTVAAVVGLPTRDHPTPAEASDGLTQRDPPDPLLFTGLQSR